MNTEAIKKLEGKGIESIDKKHGRQIIDFYKSIGVETFYYTGENCNIDKIVDRYYGNVDGNFSCRSKDKYTQIITLDQAKALISEKPFPRVMWVSDRGVENWEKRVVFDYKCGFYIAWADAETFEDAEKRTSTRAWQFAKEVEEPKPIELTLDEIANKFGVDVNQIKIKK